MSVLFSMYRKWVSISVAVLIMVGVFSPIGLATNPSTSQPINPITNYNNHRTNHASSQASQDGYNITRVIVGIIFGKYTDKVSWGVATNVACEVGALKVIGFCEGHPLISMHKDFYVAYIQVFLGHANNGRMFGLIFFAMLVN
jgi:hypothetical protein